MQRGTYLHFAWISCSVVTLAFGTLVLFVLVLAMAYQKLCDCVMADALAGVLATRLSPEQLQAWNDGAAGERAFWKYEWLHLAKS